MPSSSEPARGSSHQQFIKGQPIPIYTFHGKRRKCSNATLGDELSLNGVTFPERACLHQLAPCRTLISHIPSHISYTCLSHHTSTHTQSLHTYTLRLYTHTHPSYIHTCNKSMSLHAHFTQACYMPHTLHTHMHTPFTDITLQAIIHTP